MNAKKKKEKRKLIKIDLKTESNRIHLIPCDLNDQICFFLRIIDINLIRKFILQLIITVDFSFSV